MLAEYGDLLDVAFGLFWVVFFYVGFQDRGQPMPKMLCYRRVSTDMQSNGLDTQKQRLEACAALQTLKRLEADTNRTGNLTRKPPQ